MNSRRKRMLIVLGGLVTAGIGAALWAQVTSVVEDRVLAQAAPRGIELEFGDIDVWPNGLVRLHDVVMSRGSYRARVDLVKVNARVFASETLGGEPSIETIEVEGARIEHVDTKKAAARKRSGEDDASSDPAAALRRLGGGEIPHILVEDVELELPTVTVQIGAVEVTADQVEVRTARASGPAVEPFVTRPVTVDSVRVQPTEAVLRRDRPAIEVELAGVTVHTEFARLRQLAGSGGSAHDDGGLEETGESQNARAHRMLNRLFFYGAAVTERARGIALPQVDVVNSTVALDDHRIEATAVRASWNAAEARFTAAADVAQDGKPVGQLSAAFEADESRATVGVKQLDLTVLRQVYARSPLSGHIDADVSLTRAEDTFALQGRVAAQDATVTSKRIAENPVVFANTTYEFEGVYAPTADDLGEPKLVGHPTGGVRFTKAERTGKFEMTRGKLAARELSGDLTFAIYGLGSLPIWPARFDLSVRLPPTPAQAVLDLVPPQLLGDIHGAKFGGTVAATIDLEIPLQRASRMRWKIDDQLGDFEVVHLPERVDLRRLMGPMKTTIGSGPCRLQIEIPPMRSEQDARALKTDAEPVAADGCAHPWKYVPLDGISDYIHRGILTTEDGAFYRHTGFNEDAIRKSLEKNIQERRFARGASTISMQFVKNLFLSHDKQAARKLREAILVYLMEHVVQVPKKRIMEVYLNVIEYGAGLYGIHAAAEHYFGKSPANLSVVEVAWIITLIPGPRARYPYFKRRKIPDEWWERIRAFLDEMYRKERIDELELLTAKAHPPQFVGQSENLNDPARFRPQVEALAGRMRMLRETGTSRDAVLTWSKAVGRGNN